MVFFTKKNSRKIRRQLGYSWSGTREYAQKKGKVTYLLQIPDLNKCPPYTIPAPEGRGAGDFSITVLPVPGNTMVSQPGRGPWSVSG